MKNLVGKSLLLILIALALNAALAPTLPYPWGNRELDAKMRHFTQHQELDALILGSSWTYRHLDPETLDAELGGRAFNLASDGTFMPQIHRLFSEVLRRDDRKLRYVVVELSRFLSAVDPDQGHTKEEKHWLTWKDSAAMASALWERPDKNPAQKLVSTLLLGVQFFERLGHVGLGADAMDYWWGSPPDPRLLGRRASGFYPVDDEFADLKGKPFTNDFLTDPQAAAHLQRVQDESQRAFERFERHPRIAHGAVHTRQMLDLADWAAARQIPLFFVVPPRLGARYDLILPVAAALPPDQVVLELADPRRHPEFYRLADSIDRTHFNRAGAALYSRAVAASLRPRL